MSLITENLKNFFKRKYVSQTMKLIFVCGILYFLYTKNLVSPKIFEEMSDHYQFIVIAFVFSIISFFIGAIRLFVLLNSLSLEINLFQTLHIHIVGSFFNIALPGAVSGDFVKSYYLKKYSHNSTTKAFGILFLDRLIGVSAMVFTSTLALYSSFIHSDSNTLQLLKLLLTFLSIFLILFYSYIFFIHENNDIILFILEKFEQKLKFFSKIKTLYLSIKAFKDQSKAILVSILLSLLIQTLIGFTCYNIALALNEININQMELYAIVPIGFIVTAVPLFPGGIGTGHAAFSFLFHLMNSNRGADIFSIFAMFSFFTGALCGLYYLGSKKNHEFT